MKTYSKIIVRETGTKRDLRDLAEQYMAWRGIGESAVDLIPAEVRHPCGPIRTNEGMYWTHTPGKLKLCTVIVRMAWGRV